MGAGDFVRSPALLVVGSRRIVVGQDVPTDEESERDEDDEEHEDHGTGEGSE
jgi:hypothetical protein